MKIRYSVKTAFHGLKASKSRSLLTILGIVIGITGIMLIVSIGSGAEKLILTEIGGLGADTIVIRPGQEPTGPSDIAQTLFSDSIKKRDLVALSKKSNVPDLETMAPVVFVSGGASFGGETYSPTIFGWSAEFMGNTLNIYPEQGEYFGDAEISDRASVAVIGAKVKEELFGDVDPLGKYITIKNHKFRVMAVLPKKGQLLFFNVDEVVSRIGVDAQFLSLPNSIGNISNIKKVWCRHLRFTAVISKYFNSVITR
ncbi:MAG: hypothetical protein UY09_C0012G0048 [Parcubacteria group bacterium GW2011_GWA2_47_8]|nr:MAG: hypothetical protein UY09_C0012G0048 [Parcubacteria group bacterium GW2011_GWA2_47_8]